MVILFVVFQCVFLSFLAYFFCGGCQCVDFIRERHPQLQRWCCQGPRGVVPPQMDFITCQRGSRIKRAGLTVNHIWGSRRHLGFGRIFIQVHNICD